LTETFSNRGFAPNCMVMFAVEINVVFLQVSGAENCYAARVTGSRCE